MENVYVNIKENHFKVWGFDIYSNKTGQATVITYWGRIGLSMSKLQKKEKVFDSYPLAYNYCWDKMKEKELKGYNTMPKWQYFDAINKGKPISQLIKLIEVYQGAQDKVLV